MFYKSLLGAVAALAISTAAQAQVAVQVWTNQPAAASNATIANQPAGPANITTTVSGINFTNAPGFDSTTTTVGQWLGNPGLSSATLNNSYFLFTGQIALAAGNNLFSITHDDGLQLNIAGITNPLVVNQPLPTAPVATAFTAIAPSAGVYNFTLSYGEVQGGPAVLQWLFNGAPVGSVPEPSTWAMMLLGFGGIGFAVRRQRKAVLQAA